MKPRIICHIMSSVDGRLLDERWTRNDPPTYVVIGDSDAIASTSVMRRRVENLKAFGIDAEFHLFPNLLHGFGLGTGTSAEGWERNAVKFWGVGKLTEFFGKNL